MAAMRTPMFYRPLFFVLLMVMATPAQAAPEDCQDLHEAAFFDEAADIKFLLRNGVDPDCRDEFGLTPLFSAVEGGSLSSVGHLLLYDAEVNVRDEFGETALTRARGKFKFFSRPGGERYLLIYRGVARLIEWAGGVE